MIEFGGVLYYIDINAFDKAVSPIGFKPTDKVIVNEKKLVTNEKNEVVGTEYLETSHDRGKEIDAPRYDILRLMLETVLDYDYEDVDTSLGADRALDKTSLSYKIAFNTLYNYGIIKEKE